MGMTLIQIAERENGHPGMQAVVSFNHGPIYQVSIINPFDERQEQLLAWYFEEYLSRPYVKQTQAHEAAKSITTCGEALFQQIFGSSLDLYAAYKKHADAGLNTLQFEIIGSPAFQALHWEAMKDPHLPHPFALDASLVRKNQKPAHFDATIQPSPTIRILIVTARPDGRYDAGYRTISRPLVETLRQTSIPVEIDFVRPGTYDELERHLLKATNTHGKGYYHVIHFDVHGAVLTYEQLNRGREADRLVFQERSGYDRKDITPYTGERAFLFMESAQLGQAEPVAADELASLLTAHQIPVAILNACQSGKFPQTDEDAENGENTDQENGQRVDPTAGDTRESSLAFHLMQAGMQAVLAMGYSVTVTAASLLMQKLYERLFAGDDFAAALRTARVELAGNKTRLARFNMTIDLEDWLLPVLCMNEAVRLKPLSFTPEESRQYNEKQAARYREPVTTYGFVGRDLDVQYIERCMLIPRSGQARNILLVRGMGGVGKTTLLRHLGAWWQTTHLIEQVFVFNYNERAWKRQQIVKYIAEQLVGKKRYQDEYHSLSQEAQQARLTRELRSTRHLLILDNLESITSTHLAIRNSLSDKEQRNLQSLLTDLAGGQTLVLLGSRGDEAWLAPGTFGDNYYELAGLDPEAASVLTERILESLNATRYRADSDLQHLLKLLAGFPLALEVVLANLKRQTPAEILAALQTGDVELDIKNNETQGDKVTSILRCIEYSHSNLSEDAQNLLLCLAPFTVVFGTNWLAIYTKYLKSQPLLANLPFERWPEILSEAQNWGLLIPDQQNPVYMHLQPVFPYFLQSRLRILAQQERWTAIEAAFRELYTEIGKAVDYLLMSNKPELQLLGRNLVHLEYENLLSALRFMLTAQGPILVLYRVLSLYLEQMQEEQKGLELAEMVLQKLSAYPADIQKGEIESTMMGVLDDLAKKYLHLKKYNQAERVYQQVIELHKRITYPDEQVAKRVEAGIYHQLGLVAEHQRNWNVAEKNYQKALQIKVEYLDRHSQAKTYHLLGTVTESQEKWEEAKKYYQEELQIAIEYQDRFQQAMAYLHLGNIAQKQKIFEKAHENYNKSLEIFAIYHDYSMQATIYHNLGAVYQQQKKWDKAEDCYYEALKINIEHQKYYGQAKTYGLLGLLAEEMQEWGKASNYFLLALERFVEYEDRHFLSFALRNLARLWRRSGDKNIIVQAASHLQITQDEVKLLFYNELEKGNATEI